MNKGYAFGFLIVLLVLGLGMYVAYTGFVSSREALQALPTQAWGAGVVEATSPPTNLSSTPTAILSSFLTPTVQITISLPALTPTGVVEVPVPTNPPAPAPTEVPAVGPTEPPAALPTDTPAPQAPPPTPVPAPAYQFRLAGPPSADPNFPNCCYILGTVRDSAGNGLEGARVQALNEWNTLPPASSKGGGELGQYNIPIGRDVVTWDILVVDAAGNQISSKVQIQFDPSVANAFRVDWQRTY
jgi:hypothetical protein